MCAGERPMHVSRAARSASIHTGPSWSLARGRVGSSPGARGFTVTGCCATSTCSSGRTEARPRALRAGTRHTGAREIRAQDACAATSASTHAETSARSRCVLSGHPRRREDIVQTREGSIRSSAHPKSRRVHAFRCRHCWWGRDAVPVDSTQFGIAPMTPPAYNRS